MSVNGDAFGFGTNLLGVTTRPTNDPRVLTGTDTFAADCTSAVSEDGTEISAEWANEVTANLRALLRANGNKLDGTTPLVAEDHGDAMLVNAVLNAIQRGRTNVALDTSTNASQINAALAPAPAEFVVGMEIVVVPALDCAGASTVTLNGGAAKNLVDSDGAALIVGSYRAGKPFRATYTGAGQWQMSRRNVAADSTIWHVGTAGGTANALTTTLAPAPTASATGFFLAVRVATTNTGAATLDWLSGSPKPIVSNFTGAALTGGEMIAGEWAVLFYDGTAARLVHAAPGTHPSAAKAWVNFDGTTTPPTIYSSYNISSVVRLAQGSYRATFSKALNADRCIVAGTASQDSGYGCYLMIANTSAGGNGSFPSSSDPESTTEVDFYTTNSGSGPVNCSWVSFVVFQN